MKPGLCICKANQFTENSNLLYIIINAYFVELNFFSTLNYDKKAIMTLKIKFT